MSQYDLKTSRQTLIKLQRANFGGAENSERQNPLPS
jgi:hypothetical protein